MRKYFTLQHGLLPLVLICATATGIRFLGPQSIWLTARWVMVCVLGLYVLMNRRHLRGLSPLVLACVAFYVAWCVLTIAWSDVTRLTTMKVGALAMVTFSMFLGGYIWHAMHPPEGFVDYLWPATVMTLIAAARGGAADEGTDMFLYSGGVANPNTLGYMISASFPLLLWTHFRNSYERRGKRWPALMLIGFVVVLLLTGSRSSYLMLAAILTGYYLALGAVRAIVAVYLFGLMFVVLAAVAPDLFGAVIERKIYKGAGDRNILSSREAVWQDSFEGAQAGGWVGLGYGVSFGQQLQGGTAGFTAMGYGREKGTSHLAIVEETGLVGLGVYLVALVAIFGNLVSAYLGAARGPPRVMLGVLIGTLAGLVLQSGFEAWWVAPGSTEYFYFWTIAGTAMGVAFAVRRGRVPAMRRGAPRRQPLPIQGR